MSAKATLVVCVGMLQLPGRLCSVAICLRLRSHLTAHISHFTRLKPPHHSEWPTTGPLDHSLTVKGAFSRHTTVVTTPTCSTKATCAGRLPVLQQAGCESCVHTLMSR
jgi:hypothetical protein